MIRYKRHAEPDIPESRTALVLADTVPPAMEDDGNQVQDDCEPSDAVTLQAPPRETLTLTATEYKPRKPRKQAIRKSKIRKDSLEDTALPLLPGLEL